MIEQLNKLLSDLHISYQNLRAFHWLVKGQNFFDLHAKFQELYDATAVNIDDVAELILSYDGTPYTNFEQYGSRGELEPAWGVSEMSDAEMVMNVIRELEVLCNDCSAIISYGDDTVNDLIANIDRNLKKQKWMLKSFIS